jgi:hypothetical protein
MRSRVSPFRSGGGPLTPLGATGRPGWSGVGVGPAGREPGGPAPVREPVAPEALSSVELADFDGWMKSRLGKEASEGVGASIRAARLFDEWAFAEWWSKHRNEAGEIAKESCMRFFRRPFAGALVERTARREIDLSGEPGDLREEPMVVRAYAEIDERTGFEGPEFAPPVGVPVASAVPRLSHALEELVRKGALLETASEHLVQVWYVVTMRDVVLARGEPPRWTAVGRREVDRRFPALFQKVAWMAEGRWSAL